MKDRVLHVLHELGMTMLTLFIVGFIIIIFFNLAQFVINH